MTLRTILVLLLLAVPLSAHNGAVAIAVPVEGIVVDRDLSDWPEGIKSYPIDELIGGDEPLEAGDIEAELRVAYSQKVSALYVAVLVYDESIQIGDRIEATPQWQDGCPYGVLDMAGNVREWVADWFETGHYYASDNNPTGPERGFGRAFRFVQEKYPLKRYGFPLWSLGGRSHGDV